MSSAERSDSELMAGIKAGNTELLGVLYARYHRFVMAGARQFAPELSEEEMQDIAQEVFIAVGRAAPRYEERSRFRSWLLGITARRTRDVRRKTWLRRRLLGEHGRPAGVAVAAEGADVPDREVMIRQSVTRLLGRLPPAQREVLVLHAVEELKCDEIAALLGIRPKTVRTRLHRAREKLNGSAHAETFKELLREVER